MPSTLLAVLGTVPASAQPVNVDFDKLVAIHGATKASITDRRD